VVNRLRAMRGPGESYSDVIRRLVEIEGSMTIDLGHRRVTAQIAEAQRMARKRKPTK
jgi:predicted CopG family antitoxin